MIEKIEKTREDVRCGMMSHDVAMPSAKQIYAASHSLVKSVPARVKC